MDILALTGLRTADSEDQPITPTGLCRTLAEESWRDVSEDYKAEPDAVRYLGRTALDWRADYIRPLRLVTFDQSIYENQVYIDILKDVLEGAQHIGRDMGGSAV